MQTKTGICMRIMCSRSLEAIQCGLVIWRERSVSFLRRPAETSRNPAISGFTLIDSEKCGLSPKGRVTMGTQSRLFFLLGFALSGFFFPASAYAECGGQTQCIGVGTDAQTAGVGHHIGPFDLGTPLFTSAFGNQVIGTTSTSQTIYVAAVTGAGTAVLGTITLSGADAGSFSIAGGTCLITNPVHGGAACTIAIAFNPTAPGPKAARVDIPLSPPAVGGISGRSVGLTGTGTGALPSAVATAMSVVSDTPTTLDLAPLISGTGLLGVNITVTPANGVATLNGTRVTYTPNRGYLGADAFSYVSFSSTATSAAAVVTVSVVARADPTKDPDVVGLIGAQAQTARRFSQAQTFNFQRRMESLHSGAGAGITIAAGTTGSGPGRRFGPDSGSGPAMSLGASAGSIGGGFDIARDVPPDGLRQTGLAGAMPGLLATSFATPLLTAFTMKSLNLSNSSDRADGSSGLLAGAGVWIGGNINFGTRDQTADSSGLRFNTDGISLGADRRLSDKLALGVGLGYARDQTDIGADGTKSRSRGASIAAYGSYKPTTNTFVDGLVGYGALSFDTDRFVASVNDFARSHRKGDQLFGSLAAGYEHRNEGLLLSPYGRLDFSVDRLKEATETGAGLNALTYFDQRLPTLQFSLGLRAESLHETSFGWALPRLRVEFKNDIKSDREASIAYADQFAGPRYSVTLPGMKRNTLLVGIGSDFVFRTGLKLGIDYQVQRLSGVDSSQVIRLWLSKDLDGKGLPSVPASSRLFAAPVSVEAGYTWDNNLTRARDAADKLSDSVYSFNVSKGTVFPVTSYTRVVVNGFLDGEKLRTYSGLDRFSGGVRGEFQYRTSGEFDAPTFGIFGRMSRDVYSSQLRTGHRYSLGVTARQSVTDRIDLFGALASNVRFANNPVFDARDYAARLNLDYSLGRDGTLYLGGEYRHGDTVSTGRTSIESVAIAKSFVPDDAYSGRQLLAYRYEATTVLWTLGYNRPLGPRDSVDFSWRRAQSTPTLQSGYVPPGVYGAGGLVTVGKTSYTANQFFLVYLMRF